MKVAFDENIFLSDCKKALPEMNLVHAREQERMFLKMIDFAALVGREQYAKYYFALQDVVHSYKKIYGRDFKSRLQLCQQVR